MQSSDNMFYVIEVIKLLHKLLLKEFVSLCFCYTIQL